MILFGIVESGVTFTQELAEQVVIENEPATFFCKLSKPQQVLWYVEGKPIKEEDENYLIESINDIHSLTIPCTKVSDSGIYTVKVGDVQSAANLIVNGNFILKFCLSVHIFQTMFQCGD